MRVLVAAVVMAQGLMLVAPGRATSSSSPLRLPCGRSTTATSFSSASDEKDDFITRVKPGLSELIERTERIDLRTGGFFLTAYVYWENDNLNSVRPGLQRPGPTTS